MPPPVVTDTPCPGHPPDAPAGAGPWRPGVISNPLSGGNKGGRIRAVRSCLQGYPGIPHREVRTVADLRAALDEFAGRGVNLMIVNSGDGTVQAALTLLFNRRPFPTPPLLSRPFRLSFTDTPSQNWIDWSQLITRKFWLTSCASPSSSSRMRQANHCNSPPGARI